MGQLFTAAELSDWLHYDTHEGSVRQAERVVVGWLLEATGVDWTAADSGALPPVVLGWALELGGIAYENPTSMTTDQTGDISSGWRDRRSQIMAAARSWAQVNLATVPSSAPPRPRGRFPAASALPDRAVPWLD